MSDTLPAAIYLIRHGEKPTDAADGGGSEHKHDSSEPIPA